MPSCFAIIHCLHWACLSAWLLGFCNMLARKMIVSLRTATLEQLVDRACAPVQLTKFARLLFGMTAALVLSNLVWFLPYYKRMAELGG